MLTNLFKRTFKRQVKATWRYATRPHLGKSDLLQHFSDLGVTPGSTVLVHGSLSAHGHMKGGPNTVIASLLEYIGNRGTVAFPTHRWKSVNAGCRTFDVVKDPSEVGVLSETFRNWPGAIRSVHPSHSISAVGLGAETLTQNHMEAASPCGYGSPYHKLLKQDASIILFGVSLRRNTCFHCVEALADVPYLLSAEKSEFDITYANGKTEKRRVLCHAPAQKSRFDDLEKELFLHKCLTIAPLGKGVSTCISGRRFHDYLLPLLKQKPEYLLAQNK